MLAGVAGDRVEGPGFGGFVRIGKRVAVEAAAECPEFGDAVVADGVLVVGGLVADVGEGEVFAPGGGFGLFAAGDLAGLADQVPAGFKFSIKCTDEITIKKFTNLPCHGERAGKPNENFLNAELFKSLFLKPCHRALADHLGLVVLEFSRFYPTDYERGREFIDDLDKFLAQLPAGEFQIGTEIRNASFIHPDYFECLASHGVAHVYNSWTGTPPLAEQVAMAGSLTAGDFTGARLLLKPGRKYQQAVDSFMP